MADLNKTFGLLRIIAMSRPFIASAVSQNAKPSRLPSSFFLCLFSRIACHIGVSILLAVLVLIMGALVTTFTMSNFAGYFIYAAFGIAVASLTIMTVPVMCVP